MKTLARRPYEKQKLSGNKKPIPCLEMGKPHSGRNQTFREGQNYNH
jgi:hypothetical protein